MKRPFKKGEFTHAEATEMLGNCCKSFYQCKRKLSFKRRILSFFGKKPRRSAKGKEIWINACGNWVYAKTVQNQ